MTSRDGDADETIDSSENDASPSLSELVDKVEDRRQRTRRGEDDDGSEPTLETLTQFVDGDVNVAPDADRPIEGFESDAKTEAILEIIGDAANLLLLGPLLCPADYDLCTKLTSRLTGEPENLLLVTLTESPDERLNVLRGYLGELPKRTVILSVGDSTRSGSRETISSGDDGSIIIDSISDPTDLQRIGISISKHLGEWTETGGETVICFHSLTALLQFIEDEKTVFRFLHILRSRVQAAGATGHYHIDGGAHDEQLLSTLRPLFDETLTYTEDGSLSVKH